MPDTDKLELSALTESLKGGDVDLDFREYVEDIFAGALRFFAEKFQIHPTDDDIHGAAESAAKLVMTASVETGYVPKKGSK